MEEVSVEELQSMLANENDLLPRIVRYSAALVGTRPYWTKQQKELQWMGRGICDASPVFITLSAADHQWDDLMRHLLNYEE